MRKAKKLRKALRQDHGSVKFAKKKLRGDKKEDHNLKIKKMKAKERLRKAKTVAKNKSLIMAKESADKSARRKVRDALRKAKYSEKQDLKSIKRNAKRAKRAKEAAHKRSRKEARAVERMNKARVSEHKTKVKVVDVTPTVDHLMSKLNIDKLVKT